MDPATLARLSRLKKNVETARKTLTAAEKVLETFVKARPAAEAAARAADLSAKVTQAEAALATAETAEAAAIAAAAEAEALAAGAGGAVARQVVKAGVQQVVKRGAIAAIAEWLGISVTALLGWTVVAVVVAGGVIYVVAKNSSGETKTIPGRTQPGGGSGSAGLSGSLDLGPLGDAFAATVKGNTVDLAFPEEGGAVDGASSAVLHFEDATWGTDTFAIKTYTCLLHAFPGVVAGNQVGGNCKDVHTEGFPADYVQCTASVVWSFVLTGTFGPESRTLSGTGTESYSFEYGGPCPDDARLGLSPRSLKWSGEFDGTSVRGTIETTPPLSFTASPR